MGSSRAARRRSPPQIPQRPPPAFPLPGRTALFLPVFSFSFSFQPVWPQYSAPSICLTERTLRSSIRCKPAERLPFLSQKAFPVHRYGRSPGLWFLLGAVFPQKRVGSFLPAFRSDICGPLSPITVEAAVGDSHPASLLKSLRFTGCCKFHRARSA